MIVELLNGSFKHPTEQYNNFNSQTILIKLFSYEFDFILIENPLHLSNLPVSRMHRSRLREYHHNGLLFQINV